MDAGDNNGGTTVELIGYGFDDPSGPPRVTVGGASATITYEFLFPGSLYPFPIEHLKFTTPPGKIGFADITLSTSNGTITKKNGFQYLSRKIIPNLFPVQMVLDEPRSQLYAADSVSGDVKAVDLRTLKVITLLNVPGSPATALAITPDDRKLVVTGGNATLTVFDLGTGKILHTFVPDSWISPVRLVPNALVATSRGTTLVSVANPQLLDNGEVDEVDVQSGNAVKVVSGLAYTMLAASADGEKAYIGGLALWSAASDSFIAGKSYSYGISEIATSASGDQLAATVAVNNVDLLQGTYASDLSLINMSAAVDQQIWSHRLLAYGLKMHSSGSLQYRPTNADVEIWDAHRGNILRSVGLPGGVAAVADSLAVDRSGTKFYAAENTGVSIIDLGAAPLSIGAVVPQSGSASGGNSLTLLGSGFESGATVTIDGHLVAAHVLDSTRITFTVPAISAKKVAITVTNPGGGAYTLPASYDASVRKPEPNPVLDSFTFFGAMPPSVDGLKTITLTGGGFVADSRVLLNGLPVGTEYVSEDQIVAYIYHIQTAGQQTITVVNLGSGSISNPLYFQVPGPNISLGGLQNAAMSASSVALSAGGLATVYGNNFGSQLASASPPCPTTLKGITVEVNGVDAPLLFISPSQINFMVPWEVANAAQATVVVKLNGVASNSVTVPLAQAAPGIFVLDAAAQGAVLIAGDNAIAARTGLFSGSRPVRKGEFIEIFATGLGAVDYPPPDGQPAKGLARTITNPSVFVGCATSSGAAQLCQAPNVQFSGLAPGFAGLYQVNVEIPENAVSGNMIPLELVLGQQVSNTVYIAIE